MSEDQVINLEERIDDTPEDPGESEIFYSLERSRKRHLSPGLLRGELVADRLLEQEQSASPLLKKLRPHRPSATPPADVMALTSAEFKAYIDSTTASVLKSQEDGFAIIKSDLFKVNSNVVKNTAKLEGHEKSIKENADAIAQIRSELGKMGSKDPGFPPLPPPPSASPSNWSNTETAEYDRARRSIRMWPIVASSSEQRWKEAGAFICHKLALPEITEKMIEQVKRPDVPSGPSAKDEVLVTFRQAATRDSVLGASAKLAACVDDRGRPTAGLRLEVPPKLRKTFSLLYRFGQVLRTRHGQGFRRHIKFDDTAHTLYLNVKLPGDEAWSRVSLEVAKRGLQTRQIHNDDEVERRLDVMGPAARLLEGRTRAASTGRIAEVNPQAGPTAASAWTGRRAASVSDE